MTVWELCENIRSAMEEYGIEANMLEAREVTAAATGQDRAKVLDWRHVDVTPQQRRKAGEMLVQRLRGRPIAYIIGEWDFYGYTFRVTPDVLIPRADTETLCDAGIREAGKRTEPKVLDLCCGSGCIGIALALEVPRAAVTAVDISEKALAVTRENARRYGLEEPRYKAEWGDAYRLGYSRNRYDILISNPPYVTEQEMEELPREVRCYEPHLALAGGTDGLDFYRSIARRAPYCVYPGGTVLVECGWKQSREVQAMFRAAGMLEVEAIRDLTGTERVIRAVLPKFENDID